MRSQIAWKVQPTASCGIRDASDESHNWRSRIDPATGRVEFIDSKTGKADRPLPEWTDDRPEPRPTPWEIVRRGLGR